MQLLIYFAIINSITAYLRQGAHWEIDKLVGAQF